MRKNILLFQLYPSTSHEEAMSNLMHYRLNLNIAAKKQMNGTEFITDLAHEWRSTGHYCQFSGIDLPVISPRENRPTDNSRAIPPSQAKTVGCSLRQMNRGM